MRIVETRNNRYKAFIFMTLVMLFSGAYILFEGYWQIALVLMVTAFIADIYALGEAWYPNE